MHFLYTYYTSIKKLKHKHKEEIDSEWAPEKLPFVVLIFTFETENLEESRSGSQQEGVVATVETVQEWLLGVGRGRLEAGTRSPVGNAHSDQNCWDNTRSEAGRKERLGHQKIE